MSIVHKNTGDTVSAGDYNDIADGVNNAIPKVPLGVVTIDLSNGTLSFQGTEDGFSSVNNEISVEQIYLQYTDIESGDFAQFLLSAGGGSASGYFRVGKAGASLYKGFYVDTDSDELGLPIWDDIDQIGLIDKADYSVNGKQNPLWKATWGAVLSLFGKGVATLVNGQISVDNPLIKKTSRQITINYKSVNGTLGFLSVLDEDIIDNTSFIIKSLKTDGTINTDDNSDVRWCVISD